MSEKLTIKISDDLHGMRLDAAIASKSESLSRSVLKGYITDGLVTLNDSVVTKSSVKVMSGDVVQIDLPEPESLDAQPQDLPLDVVYEDEDVLVINKPVGFVVHPGAGIKDGTVMNAVLFHYPKTATLPRAGIVHRLDKDTSGLMVIALSEIALSTLTKAISRHDVVREYEAIAEGLITSGGTVDAPIDRDPHQRTRMSVVPEGFGREAVTHYRVMEQFRAHTLLRLRLETGRTHQIRVHMASIHHPLLGDVQYGGKRLKSLNKASVELDEALRAFRHQALHAAHIEFVHPTSGEAMSFDAPLPEDFSRLIDLLRRDKAENGEF
ncbi:MAG: 23S rRNA pseudouridine(1911/1915/1917) synthase RluD [Succinivibrio sp.]|nr:23S rRNA pseudouridine(1911/1915/1917) synthase RluD [Succinivibrio sp.]